MNTKWKEIWKSDSYKAEIYDNCSTRVYTHTGKNMVKIEADGTYWSGNTGGFKTYKYFLKDDNSIQSILGVIQEYDEDEASSDDVQKMIETYTTAHY
ncbi:MAG: hypothetical protein ACE5KZ_15425 [Candidatus Scalinduaceae bacterium]